jgi:hypothetical protein
VHRSELTALIHALLVMAIVLPLYAVRKYTDYPVRPVAEYPTKVTRANVTIAVEPVENLAEQKTYFNTDMTSQGFMPVFIVIQNDSILDSFLFEKANIGYARISSNSADAEVAKVRLFGGPSYVKSMAVQENMVKREIKSKTLSPGESVHGFLYIPVPKWNGSRQKIHLQVPITKSGTSETYILNLFF